MISKIGNTKSKTGTSDYLRLPHCKILDHQVEYCKSLTLFDVDVKMGFLRWLLVKLSYDFHIIRLERLQSLFGWNIKSLGSTVLVWQTRTFGTWKSVGAWLTPLREELRTRYSKRKGIRKTRRHQNKYSSTIILKIWTSLHFVRTQSKYQNFGCHHRTV